jgi:hypothetical protein
MRKNAVQKSSDSLLWKPNGTPEYVVDKEACFSAQLYYADITHWPVKS